MSFHRITQGKSALEKNWSVDTSEVEPTGRSVGRFAGLALLLLALVVSATLAADPDEYAPGIVGVPLSNRLISGEIAFTDGELAQFSAREGTVITVKSDDYHVAFVPKINDDGEVDLSLFQVTTVLGLEGGEAAKSIGTAVAPVGGYALNASSIPFDVKVLGVAEEDFKTGFYSPGMPRDTPFLKSIAGKACCARTCNGTIVCGCSVVTGCASCCSGDCCGGDPRVLNQGLTAETSPSRNP